MQARLVALFRSLKGRFSVPRKNAAKKLSRRQDGLAHPEKSGNRSTSADRTESVSDEAVLPDILFSRVESLEEYHSFLRDNDILIQKYRRYELALTEESTDTFLTQGYCVACDKECMLTVDYTYGKVVEGRRIPNWRERLVCTCRLNNRIRAAYHFITRHIGESEEPQIYIAEQTTPLYQLLKERFPLLIGSEYGGEKVALGGLWKQKYRNEDATRLTFEDDSLDIYLSFDVFEHIPDFKKALAEAVRVLRPGGRLIFTVPFNSGSEKNIVRAIVKEDGSIEHLLPEERHGDPLRKDGALCYYHFGWELIDDLRKVGFETASAYYYLSQRYGYLGGPNMIFCAQT